MARAYTVSMSKEQVLSLPRDEQEDLVEQILLNLGAPSPEEYERI